MNKHKYLKNQAPQLHRLNKWHLKATTLPSSINWLSCQKKHWVYQSTNWNILSSD